MKSILSVAVLALIGQVPAHRLSQQQRILSNLRYEESEGPTKADNGENDVAVMTRESDKNDKSEKESGWTNPLSWSDTGEDDDEVLNMKFKPLDEEYKQWSLPQYEIDEDIDVSMRNEKVSEVEVKKQRARWAEMEKKEAENKAIEDQKMKDQAKEQDAQEAKKLKKNLEVEEEKKEKKPAEEEKAKPQKAEKKEEAPKEKPAAEKEQKKEKVVEKAPAEEKKEAKEEVKPAAKPQAKEESAPVQKEEGKVVKPAPEKPQAAMQTTRPGFLRLDGDEIEVTDLDDDDEIARQQNPQMVQQSATNVMDYDVDENE